MGKYLIGLVALIILLGGGYYLWDGMGAEPLPEEPMVEKPQAFTYASSTLGISLTYPSDFTLNQMYAYDQFGADKLIHGVSFTIPASMATGTNLASDSYLSIETLPRANRCTGDIFLLANVRAEEIVDGGMEWALASSTEVAVDNIYEEYVYALVDSKPCLAVRYFIHSSNIDAFEPGVVREFDHSALLSAFDGIRRSLVVGAPPATTTSTF